MTGDKANTLSAFNALGGVCLSVKCLDEGVDIPSVSHALVLSSSQNPREFIQRRGRVLRRSPGKNVSYIYDAIVVLFEERDRSSNQDFLLAELSRAILFGQDAINSNCVSDLERLALEYNLDPEKIADLGSESDE
jgi:superfamily II DNA or RNA helicase